LQHRKIKAKGKRGRKWKGKDSGEEGQVGKKGDHPSDF